MSATATRASINLLCVYSVRRSLYTAAAELMDIYTMITVDLIGPNPPGIDGGRGTISLPHPLHLG